MTLRPLTAALLVLIVAAPLPAQSPRDRVTILNVRVGFTPGPHFARPEDGAINERAPMFKSGGWTPIAVTVQNTGRYDSSRDGPLTVSVETSDTDDTANTFSAALPPFDEGGSSSAMVFTRPGARYADFTVRITAAGREVCTAFQQNYSGLDANQVLYLALGSRLPGLKLPSAAATSSGNPPRADVGLITRPLDLPTLWFGYGSADVVLLCSSDRDFMTALIGDQSGRRAALAEWVRRGGKLVISAGKNRDLFAGAADLQALLPMTIEGPYVTQGFSPNWRDGGTRPDSPLANADGKPLELTRLRPREDRQARVLIDGPAADASPLVVQAPYGLGRVTLVAFDLDQKPFRGWSGETMFWEQLLARSGPRLTSGQAINQVFGQMGDEADMALQQVSKPLDQFEGVPVISFGWVALFILLYILVVGPLDYFFLKKVVKRLELTWITFPTVVLAVSAAAYFTAYHLKGSDLRVNRTDVVDFDFQTKQAYGRTFFCIFSPRIQKYTVGVSPSDGWAGPASDAASPGTVVSWFGAPKQGRQSIFRHSYEYAPKAVGLTNVPIQVWSTKGFQTWTDAPMDRDRAPFAASLSHPTGKPDDLIGTISNQLPTDLEDAILIYRGQVASLGTLLRDTPKTVSAAERTRFTIWRSSSDSTNTTPGVTPMMRQQSPSFSGSAVAQRLAIDLLFHEASTADSNNGSLRDLDQSWRISDENRDEAILVARLPQSRGTAESINTGPNNPTRLWLGELPTKPNAKRPDLQGTMRQDVYVRVFVPVNTAATK